MHSMTNANNSVRMKRICIVFPLLSIPRLPDTALLPRVAWTERQDVELIVLSVEDKLLRASPRQIRIYIKQKVSATSAIR
jgi:hypothetical protein